ncbi:hypothetical protein [Streptomyces sp. NPDC051129]|uniref:hypothetical protein n=2 Tax=Streptomyces TaxID=1883 RepID=UPI003419DCDE
MLEVAPAYLSDIEAADVLALLCDQIGEPLEHGLAARRYAMSDDRRALHGTVLQTSHPGRSCETHSPFPQAGAVPVRVWVLRRGPAAVSVL